MFSIFQTICVLKELENEKVSLTTTLKIFYEDFYQAHKTCLKQQGPVYRTTQMHGNQQDKAQINQVEKQPDINIIARNENGRLICLLYLLRRILNLQNH
jgi:hypothetical protein